MVEVESKNLVVFSTNLHLKDTFAHEIAHVAGLEHSFKEKDDLTKKDILEYNKRKKQVDEFFDSLIKKGYSKEEIGKLWKSFSREMREINSTLYTLNRNMHKFQQGKTDNFMDYYNKRKSFWKFQWKALQEDIIKFY